MKRDKRVIRRPWGRRKNGGWIIQPDDLLTALKDGQIAEIGKLRVGAKQLSTLINNMQFPEYEFLVTTNGCLEVQTIKRVVLESKEGYQRTEFRKTRLQHSFRVNNGAWLPKTKTPKLTVVIKPRKFA